MRFEELGTLDKTSWQDIAGRMRFETRLFIDGEFVDSKSGGRFPTINPATGETIAEMSEAGEEDVDRAVASAKRAFRSGSWSRMAPRDRMDVLFRLAELIEEHAHELAVMDSLDAGKPISDVAGYDMPDVALNFRYFAECIDKIEGTVTNTAASALHYVLREPLGVVGAISPWNYPLLMATWKVAPALAAGNAVVLKPAEQAPLSCLLLARLFVEAGGPPGILNVLNGYGEKTGRPLCLHDDVAKITFTGSAEVGKKILIYAGQSNMKRVALECGGKSPQIFLNDLPDLDRAVTYAYHGIYANMGEVCNASSRFIVDERIYDAFVERFTELGRDAYRPGDPLDPATNMGPLITREALDRVMGYIESGTKEGARLAFGGNRPGDLPAEGFYVNPTLFIDVRNDMRIAREEIFGPVAAAIPVASIEEAVAVANDTIYGLTAGVHTKDIDVAHRFIRDIEAGIVWVNCYDEADMTQPFGGTKQSGNSRDKCFESILSYTQEKSAWIRLD